MAADPIGERIENAIEALHEHIYESGCLDAGVLLIDRVPARTIIRVLVADALLEAGKSVKEMPAKYWASEPVGPEQVEVFGRAVLEVAAQEIYKRAEEIRHDR